MMAAFGLEWARRGEALQGVSALGRGLVWRRGLPRGTFRWGKDAWNQPAYAEKSISSGGLCSSADPRVADACAGAYAFPVTVGAGRFRDRLLAHTINLDGILLKCVGEFFGLFVCAHVCLFRN